MFAKLIFGVFMLFVIIMVIGSLSDRPIYPGGLSKMDARTKCESLIKGISVNPSTVIIDSGTEQINGETIQFDWDASQLQMQNRMGAMLGTTASCTINLKSGHVDNLHVM